MNDLIIDTGIDAEYIDLGILNDTTISQNNNLSFSFDGNIFDENTGYNVDDIYNISLDRDTSISVNNVSTSASDSNLGISVVVAKDTNNNGLLDLDEDTIFADDAIDTTNGDESLNMDLSTGNYLLWVSLTGTSNETSTQNNIDDVSLDLNYSLDISNASGNNSSENNTLENSDTQNNGVAQDNINTENSHNTEIIFQTDGDETSTFDPAESNDGMIDAGTVENNFAVVNTYENGSGQDSYQFEVARTGTYDVELGNLEANLNISITDSEGNELYSSSESGNTSEYIAADFEAGTYQAHITGEDNAETSYSFNITQTSSEDNSSSNQSNTEDDSTAIISQGDIVYRFGETDALTQFYTTSEVERDSVIENLPNYEYEGESFTGAPNPEEDITGVVPVYRFFNSNTGVHLYTSSEVERNAVTKNLPNYTPEGISYYAYESQQEGSVPLYRFYNSSLDAHFYTPSAEERDEFIASSAYQPEGGEDGIACYVQPIIDI